jgi:hypothetical protein
MTTDLFLEGKVSVAGTKIHGVAIHPGMTDHKKDKETAFKDARKYLPDRLKNAAPTLEGKPIFLDHDPKQPIGTVTLARWDEAANGVYYEGTITMEMAQKVANGEITAVSVGVNPWVKGGGVEWLDGLAPYGFVFEELSLIDPQVMLPGDPQAWVKLMEAIRVKCEEARQHQIICVKCGGECSDSNMKCPSCDGLVFTVKEDLPPTEETETPKRETPLERLRRRLEK